MAMKKETLLRLPYDDGEVYAIGKTPNGELLATGTMETKEGEQVLVVVAESNARPVPLDSFFRFQVPIEFYEEPIRWEGRV